LVAFLGFPRPSLKAAECIPSSVLQLDPLNLITGGLVDHMG
jgi:hypothetical protein